MATKASGRICRRESACRLRLELKVGDCIGAAQGAGMRWPVASQSIELVADTFTAMSGVSPVRLSLMRSRENGHFDSVGRDSGQYRPQCLLGLVLVDVRSVSARRNSLRCGPRYLAQGGAADLLLIVAT